MIFLDYIFWHYAVAPRNILGLLKNYLLGTWRKFLIWRHLKTLFSPWHRMRLQDLFRPNNLGDKIINFWIDFFARIIAACARLIIVLIGLSFGAVVLLFFIFLFIAWLAWPVIFAVFVKKGLSLIF